MICVFNLPMQLSAGFIVNATRTFAIIQTVLRFQERIWMTDGVIEFVKQIHLQNVVTTIAIATVQLATLPLPQIVVTILQVPNRVIIVLLLPTETP